MHIRVIPFLKTVVLFFWFCRKLQLRLDSCQKRLNFSILAFYAFFFEIIFEAKLRMMLIAYEL